MTFLVEDEQEKWLKVCHRRRRLHMHTRTWSFVEGLALLPDIAACKSSFILIIFHLNYHQLSISSCVLCLILSSTNSFFSFVPSIRLFDFIGCFYYSFPVSRFLFPSQSVQSAFYPFCMRSNYFDAVHRSCETRKWKRRSRKSRKKWKKKNIKIVNIVEVFHVFFSALSLCSFHSCVRCYCNAFFFTADETKSKWLIEFFRLKFRNRVFFFSSSNEREKNHNNYLLISCRRSVCTAHSVSGYRLQLKVKLGEKERRP